MDPATLFLIGAGLLAATRIKRGARPKPPPAPAPEPAVEPVFPGWFPPFALYSGRGLRPAVTGRHREGTSGGGGSRGRS
jgi:hypothetical protein